MSSKAVGIVNLHYASGCGGLNVNRSIASTSYISRYAFMDFPLSNFSNSGIDKSCVLVKNHLRSIIQHIGGGHVYNKNSKLGGVTLLYDEVFSSNEIYNHDINNLAENSWYIKSLSEDTNVFVIAPSHIIYKMDYRPYIEDHVANKNKISIFYSKINNAKTTFTSEQVVKVDDNGILVDIHNNLGNSDNENVFLQTIIIDKEILSGLVELGKKTSSLYTLLDVIKSIYKDIPIHCYEYKGVVRCFDSLEHYLEYSQEFLFNEEIRKNYFDSSWPIYTKSFDTPPAKYKSCANVQNSFVANGCQIEGTIINSIIGRDVVVKPGAVIKDSVVLTGSYISESTHLENVVVDKEAKIIHKKEIIGSKSKVQYIKRGDIV